MPKNKMDGFGWCWMVICLLLCTPTDIFVVASPEVNETQEYVPVNVYHDTDVTRKKIVTAQFECYQKIMKDNDHNKIGPVCNRTWDGWLCWDDTEAGFTSEQYCPDYFQDFDPSVPAYSYPQPLPSISEDHPVPAFSYPQPLPSISEDHPFFHCAVMFHRSSEACISHSFYRL